MLTIAIAASCGSPEPKRETTSTQAPTTSAAPTTSVAPTPPEPSLESDLQFCVSETNRYRASLGLPPLARSSTLEAYAAAGARQDGLARAPHQHFKSMNGGGVALAENEIPWWPATSVRAVIDQGLAMMWAEGPGGGHFENMRGRYVEVGCGVFVNGSEITVVQNFR